MSALRDIVKLFNNIIFSFDFCKIFFFIVMGHEFETALPTE